MNHISLWTRRPVQVFAIGIVLLTLQLACVRAAATVYYVDSAGGLDGNDGQSPSTAWQSLIKVQSFLNSGGVVAGTQILFVRGGTWIGGLTLPTGLNGTAGNPITFGNYPGSYGSALPIIDGGSSAIACFYARATGSNSTPLWSYVTINGFECRNTTEYGVLFYQNKGGSAGMPGILVENMNIHNTGPGAYAGGGSPFDDNQYRNQLMFLDENDRADGVQFLNNIVNTCGGHNCIQVQLDTGSPRVIGNTCYGWTHNCIDVKQSTGVLVQGNLVHGPATQGSAFYYENPSGSPTRNGSISWVANIAYDVPNGLECEGAKASGTVSCNAYNNTLYLGTESAIVSASRNGVSWDVRSNILDTTDPIFVCDANNSNKCGEIKTWDYNDDGGTHGNVNTAVVGPHDITGARTSNDPLFVDAANADFHLQSVAGGYSQNSPCLNAGDPSLTWNVNMGGL